LGKRFDWAFFSSNAVLTANSHVELSQNTLMSEIEQRLDLGSVVWQQDEAAPHLMHIVFNLGDEKFPVWIGRCRQAELSPRSPDLTPRDFSVWYIFRCDVYSKKRADVLKINKFMWNLNS
jgi:hypothetical protein